MGLVAAGAVVVGAHAILTRSSLDGATVRPYTPITVTLAFNAAIERGFTRVVLVDAARTERPLELAPAEKEGEVKVTLPGLEPGLYGLRYRILAADGHSTESILRFRVAAAAP